MKNTQGYLFALLAAIAMAAPAAAASCDYQPGFDESGAALQVVEPTYTLGSGDSPPESRAVMASILGELKNPTASCVEGIVIETKFFDAQKKLIDASTQPLSDVEVTPGQTVAFRSVVFATRPKENYSSMAVRVVAAHQIVTKKPRAAEPERSWLVETLLGWAPMLLLIAVWLFFILRMNSKKSPQRKMQARIDEQTALLHEQVKVLEKIAAALEARKPQA